MGEFFLKLFGVVLMAGAIFLALNQDCILLYGELCK